MTEAIDSFLVLALIAVTAWALAFGLTSAAIARDDGRSAAFGMGLGVLLGPLAWATLWVLRRRSAGSHAARAARPPRPPAATKRAPITRERGRSDGLDQREPPSSYR